MTDSEILSINSPKDIIKGPFAILHKDQEDRWAAVALLWNGQPRIGIRWFWPPKGNPLSHGCRTWFIVPPLLNDSIIQKFALNSEQKLLVDNFLSKNDSDGVLLKTNYKYKL